MCNRLSQTPPWLRWKGYVADLGAELASASVYAAPLTMGGGMKNKTLEAMASGLPIVGTPEAFAGMDLFPGVHGVWSTPDRFADDLIALLRDELRQRLLGTAARAWVEQHADWNAVAGEFERLWLNVA
jgi:glycosyltransferase involved in cell wall biosynthesis